MLWCVDARSIVRADAFILLLTLLLLFPVMRGLSKLTQATIIVLLAALMMTPLKLDSFWGTYSYVADYNRWAWGCLTVALVWALNPLARGYLSSICVALALCLLLYLKLTFFVGGCLCLGLGFLRGKRLGDYLIPIFIVLLAISIGVWNGQFLPYLADNITIGRSTGTLRLGKLLLQLLDRYNL